MIAYVYHWGRTELWDMSVSERRMWVKFIQQQHEAEKDAIEGNTDRATHSNRDYDEAY